VILVDTGPLVALFEPRDSQHQFCADILKDVREPLVTAVPVLTEAFHILPPDSRPAENLRLFIDRGGLSTWPMQGMHIRRAFDLMRQYADHPMDFADASMIVAAEEAKTRQIFTIDRNDFETYRLRIGQRHVHFQILGPGPTTPGPKK